MTFIKPKKEIKIWNFVIGSLVVLCVVGTFGLIAMYNSIVNINHAIAGAKSQLDTIGAENTSFNNQIVAMLGSGAVAQAAQQDNLVEDNNPHYFETNQQWALASQP